MNVSKSVVARRMITALSVLVGIYAATALVAFLSQRALIYPAPDRSVVPSAQGATLHRFETALGQGVYALHAPAPPGAPTIVHFHGNGETLADQGALIGALRARGVGVFAVEYPGYGLQRAETAKESSLYEAAEGALDFLEQKLGVARQQIVLLGQSLGSGVAVEMAARGRGGRLILISPFTSLVDVARRSFPFLPVRWMMLDRYDTWSKAPGVTLPVLVIHGERDGVVPSSMGHRLLERFADARGTFIPEAGHNDLFAVAGGQLLDEIARFAR